MHNRNIDRSVTPTLTLYQTLTVHSISNPGTRVAQWKMDDVAAAALARLAALCLGWDAFGAMASECKEVTPTFFADVRDVRTLHICQGLHQDKPWLAHVHARISTVGQALRTCVQATISEPTFRTGVLVRQSMS